MLMSVDVCEKVKSLTFWNEQLKMAQDDDKNAELAFQEFANELVEALTSNLQQIGSLSGTEVQMRFTKYFFTILARVLQWRTVLDNAGDDALASMMR